MCRAEFGALLAPSGRALPKLSTCEILGREAPCQECVQSLKAVVESATLRTNTLMSLQAEDDASASLGQARATWNCARCEKLSISHDEVHEAAGYILHMRLLKTSRAAFTASSSARAQLRLGLSSLSSLSCPGAPAEPVAREEAHAAHLSHQSAATASCGHGTGARASRPEQPCEAITSTDSTVSGKKPGSSQHLGLLEQLSFSALEVSQHQDSGRICALHEKVEACKTLRSIWRALCMGNRTGAQRSCEIANPGLTERTDS